MASNYNRKSGSSGSSRRTSRSTNGSRSRGASSRTSGRQNAKSRAASSRQPQAYSNQEYSSRRIGDINQSSRVQRAKKVHRRYLIRFIVIAVLVIGLIVGGIVVYNSSLFTVTSVKVTGVEHLTATEMTELAAVPEGTTLLRSDSAGIKQRLSQNAWVKEVDVKPIFPDTLELVVTEREIAAVVQVPVNNASATQNWAIASDGIWLMSIPDKNSDRAAAVSSKVYEDAEKALSITDVLANIAPQVGSECTDDSINNALAIVDGLTTELADQVKKVSATGAETTTLTLDNGVEIAFGLAENIREKERVCLQLMEENPGKIAYINVRVVDRPTWRAI